MLLHATRRALVLLGFGLGTVHAEPLPNVPWCTVQGDQLLRGLTPDGQGGVLGVWLDRRAGGSGSDVYAGRLAVSGAVVGSWPEGGAGVEVGSGVPLAAAILGDGQGGAFVAWSESRGAAPDIFAQHLDAAGRRDPRWPITGLSVCSASGTQSEPAIVSDGLGGIYIVWTDSRQLLDSDVYAQHVSLQGVVDSRWPADGLRLCETNGPQTAPVVIGDGAGGLIAAWEDDRSSENIDIFAQRVGPTPVLRWGGPGREVCYAPGDQQRPAICSDGAGGAIIAWQDLRGTYYDVYAQRIRSNGDTAWLENGVAVCTSPGGQFEPQVVADAAGGAFVVWFDARNTTSFDIYVHRLSSLGTGAPGWAGNGTALCRASGDQVYPRATADGEGGIDVVWTDYRAGAQADVYAQRITAIGVIPASWPTDGIAMGAVAADQEAPLVAANGRGRAFVAWTDARGTDRDIYAAQIGSSGEDQANYPNATLASDAEGDQSNEALDHGTLAVPDGRGGAYLVWEDRGPLANGVDVVVQRLVTDGAIAAGWPQAGIPVCRASGDQTRPTLAGDGQGGVFVAWQDGRAGGAQNDLYVQRLAATGASMPGWRDDGVVACSATGNQLQPQLLADGTGGVYVTWVDYRQGPEADIDVLRLTNRGEVATGWPVGGLAVCAESRDQLEPTMVTNGRNGILVFWSDARTTAAAIYGTSVSLDGGIVAPWPANGKRLCSATSRQHAPQAVADASGGAYVFWLDHRGSVDRPYAQRISGTGVLPPSWVQTGTAVSRCAQGSTASALSAVADGAGGAIAAWSELNSDGRLRIAAQRLRPDATMAWPAPGAPSCTPTDHQLYPTLGSDFEGGAIVSWVDLRAGAPDVYAQHIGPAGVPPAGWPTSGLVVSNASGVQMTPAVVTSPGCAAFVTWSDFRAASADVYATHFDTIYPVTDLNVPAASPRPRCWLRIATRNPFRGAMQLDLTVDAPAQVQIDVFDVAGRKIRSLGEATFAPGTHRVWWDGCDARGVAVAAGPYFVVARGAGFAADAKIVRRP